ncbi:hypothetical protein T03_4080 [Trichinella britovi]|uniref:Uncharacterized protein n=1 Tax=Trichinella britovi TaxID=45882 RepID=A0A0V1D4V6_TRIBR|nr:hypothetical protein T03_4080 [Trichinella britovi]
MHNEKLLLHICFEKKENSNSNKRELQPIIVNNKKTGRQKCIKFLAKVWSKTGASGSLFEG